MPHHPFLCRHQTCPAPLPHASISLITDNHLPDLVSVTSFTSTVLLKRTRLQMTDFYWYANWIPRKALRSQILPALPHPRKHRTHSTHIKTGILRMRGCTAPSKVRTLKGGSFDISSTLGTHRSAGLPSTLCGHQHLQKKNQKKNLSAYSYPTRSKEKEKIHSPPIHIHPH